MKVTSKLRYAKISPQKTRLIIDMIRGSEVLQAMKLVQFLPQKGAKIVSKVLESLESANARLKELKKRDRKDKKDKQGPCCFQKKLDIS